MHSMIILFPPASSFWWPSRSILPAYFMGRILFMYISTSTLWMDFLSSLLIYKHPKGSDGDISSRAPGPSSPPAQLLLLAFRWITYFRPSRASVSWGRILFKWDTNGQEWNKGDPDPARPARGLHPKDGGKDKHGSPSAFHAGAVWWWWWWGSSFTLK